MAASGQQLSEVRERVLDAGAFVELVARFKNGRSPWRQVRVRPVLLKAGRRLQFSYLTKTQDITKNYEGSRAARKLDELLALPFSSLAIKTTGEQLKVARSPDGRPLLRRHVLAEPRLEPLFDHDHGKRRPLPAGRPDALLEKLGVMDSAGRVRPSMHDKFAQVNEFLKLLEQGLRKVAEGQQELRIVDLGCGSSLLTFAAYHYLAEIKGLDVSLTGVDLNPELIAKCVVQRDSLGLEGVTFQRSSILDYSPDQPPDVVLALHACDTATDEALAQAIRWRAKLILCAPCCQKDLNSQIMQATLKPLLRYGILRERMADIVTDGFRAHILRLNGYRAEVIQFVGDEHTARNVLIRAVKTERPANERIAREYEELKRFWGVTPHLEKLVASDGQYLTQAVSDAGQIVGTD